ncbi:MAG: O-antigen ligase family protein [Syntrophobacteraceae bacterium]
MPARSAFATFDLFELACSLLLFAYMASEIRNLSELRLIAALLILLATFEGLLALAQYVTGSNLGFGFVGSTEFLTGYIGLLSISRVMGTVGHPNSLAMLFDLLLPFTFAFLLFYPMQPWKKTLTGLAVAVQYLGLGVTFSRGGIACSTLAMAAILFIYLKRRLDLFRGMAAFLFIAVVSSVLLLVIPNPIQKGLFRTEAATAYGRIPLVKVALNVIRERPLFGLGLNSYVERVGPYDDTAEQLNRSWNSPVHNLFLFIAGEIGVLGLFFFLCLVWTVLHPLPGLFAIDNPVLSCAAMGILWGSLAFFGHCMVDLTLWTHPRLHWFMLGLGVSIWRMSLSYPDTGQPVPHRHSGPAANAHQSRPARADGLPGRTGI